MLKRPRVGAKLRGGEERGRYVVDHIQSVVFGGEPCLRNGCGCGLTGNQAEGIAATAIEFDMLGTAYQVGTFPPTGRARVGT